MILRYFIIFVVIALGIGIWLWYSTRKYKEAANLPASPGDPSYRRGLMLAKQLELIEQEPMLIGDPEWAEQTKAALDGWYHRLDKNPARPRKRMR